MLSQIREKITGPVAWIFLGVIGASFVFVGVGFNASFLGSNYAAKVNGEEIPVAFFENQYRNFIAQNPQFATVGDSLRLQIRRELLDRTIREVLIDEYLRAKGFAVGDERVTEMIQQIPEFQTDGVFDMETYRSFLGLQGMTPTQFELEQRQRIREQQLSLAIGATALVSPAEYRRYLNLVAEQRVVTLVELTADMVDETIEVSEEEILAFYDENASLYQQPESADIEYILISRDTVAERVEITEAELAEYYEQEKSRYLQEEQRQARHILILTGDDEAAALEQAEALAARAKAGEPFEDLARSNSMDGGTASNGGDLGVLTRTQLPGELGAAIFAMEEGRIEGPIETEFGFHVVRLDRILEQGPLPLEQVRGDLLAELQDEEADGAFMALERTLSDALFDTPDMAAIAAAAELEVMTLAGFTRDGGGELGANQVAIDTVFDSRVLVDGEISDVVELDADSSAIFKVTQYNESRRLPLEDVRDQVDGAIRGRKADEMLAARADSIVEAVQTNGDLGEAAAAVGAEPSAPQLLTRDNQLADPSVVFSVFTSPKPTPAQPTTSRVRNQSGGYTVFSIDAVLPGRPESIPLNERDEGKLLLAQQSGVSDYAAFVEALVDSADIIIDEDVVVGEGLLQ
ncbi:MAG: SurA N-terminal domain-containing protein [Woeseiaceae bacterium]|nr:SurA N-terminal domain-containing protein [Woeseiaceae bacterium]